MGTLEESMVNVVPSDIKREEVASLIQLQTVLPDGINPIKRVHMIPSEVGGQVSFNELDAFEQDEGSDDAGKASRHGTSQS